MSFPHVARQQSGVTLVELSVTLVVIAVLAGMAVSATGLLGQAMLSGRVKGASEELATAIRSTRELAVAQARDHCISMSAGQYRIFRGGRSGTACTGTATQGPVDLSGSPSVTTVALRFTPVSTVDPVGPTTITVTTADAHTGGTCSVVLTVTPEGGVQQPGATC
jgi:prepilin-type N-terminal cleavage/methylation domain-containing protein